MASPYRTLKPAPSKDILFRRVLQDRTVARRNGMVKSACWECRKRKAKVRKESGQSNSRQGLREMRVYFPILNFSLNEGKDYSMNMMGSIALSSSFKQPSTLYPSLVSPADNLPSELAESSRASSHQRIATYQAGSQSLFCEPLFDYTDYYLATSVTRPMQQDVLISHHRRMDLQHTHTIPSQDQLMETKETTMSTFEASSQTKLIIPAVTSLNTEPDPGGLDDAFGDVYKRATNLLKEGEPMDHIVGNHPNNAALYDQAEFDKSCLLSQWAARMVYSVKGRGCDFTCFASMSVFWYVMRWMIDPSPETYAAMPEWIRPT
ncbi:hypothetical protein C2857_000068 [Epichloe festucae Fl1]|uniref:Uncharacterized protein n=1 Tax=Epichloe festucae (strain Fl1) TaxID=877507 RepID=A0A7S9KJZ6_EPIFF|nr:hypothetical protein C2857_000068 [Epichloe festucae Fl1]